MSNTKHLADLLKVCSILPALAIMPAMADLPNTTGNAWVFGDLNLGALASDSVVGGRYVSVNANKVNDLPKYKMVGRSVNLSGTTDNRPDVYVGPVELTLRELSSDEKFACNWQTADGSENSNWVGTELDDGEKSMTDFDLAKKFDIEWGDSIETILAKTGWNPSNQEHRELAGVLWSFANRDATKTAGALAANNADLTVDGAKISADSILLTNSTLNIVKQSVPVDFQEEEYRNIDSDGVTTFVADKFTAKDNTRILVGAGAELDLTGVKDALFTNNVITGNNDGGAIYNAGKLTIADSDFVENSALEQGGAIYNASGMTIEDSKFSKNSVTTGDGGAIKINVVNGSKTIIKDSDFSENKALGYAAADSGAISISNGDVEISGSDFDKNEAKFGGAMYLYSGNNHHVVVDVTDSEFNENTALSGGAIINIASKKNNEKGGLRLTDVTLSANKATSSESSYGGGALFLGADSQTVITRGVLDGNTSAARGGAIATRVFEEGDNKDALLDIKNTMFKNNIAAANGGAFDNFFYHSATNADAVYVQGSNFVNNSALNGGAIYNHGSTSTQHPDQSVPEQAAAIEINNAQFVGNIASVAGGAIYNEAGATTVLSGNNLFSGNVANKLANDIHNMGTLNITSGTTAFDGGVTGTGTFTLASDATLELGTATINQGKIDLYGTVVASMLNDSVRGGSYGRFISSDLNVDTGASFKLNVGAAGTYNIWNGKIVDAEQVTVGDIYEIAGIDVNGVKIVTKSVADIAETVGISTQAAGAVAGLANANSGKAHQVSLALQDALNAGDVEYIERETKKLNPTDKPVAQAAASSVQNQVLSLTSGRMTGGISVGRAGGDERSQENGFWIQGLFNKSKFADAFHGYTRGVALGADTLIDNKWTIGGGLAFNNTDVHADGVNTDIDTKTMFLYGQYKPSEWFVNATATYSMSEYTENKTVAGVGLGATYDVDAYGAQIMTGYDFTPGITTEAGLRYLHVAQEAHSFVKKLDTDFLSGIAGLKYAFAIENDWAIQLRPELRAAMTYDFISDEATATVVMPGVASYKVDAERLSRMGGEFGIGLTALYKGMEVSLMYDLDLHKDYTSQTGMIKFRGRF